MSPSARRSSPALVGRLVQFGVAGGLLLLLTAVPSAPAPAGDQAVGDKEALAALQGFVGDWRGVGQVRRGSTKGAWRETCGWSWKFTEQRAALTFTIDDPRFLRAGALHWNPEDSLYELVAQAVDPDDDGGTGGEDETVTYRGERDARGKLVLVADKVPPALPARLSFRQVAGGDRLIVLYERRAGANRYLRMAEVGYTRQGSNFGKGVSFVECVVTGGVGTIRVSHEGQTYYVCCSGCKEYFDADPAGVLAEYRERKEEEKRQSASKPSGSE